MENIPSFINFTFLSIVIAVLGFLFYAFNYASKDSRNFSGTIAITFIGVWLFVLSILTFNGFFKVFDGWPPRLVYIIGPPLITLIIIFTKKSTRDFLLKLPLTTLTYIHIVRVPVEIVLWWLSQENVIPVSLTFEGNNFDIISGISAPFAGVFLVGMRSKSRIGAIMWNILTLGLLFNIVIRAIAATPYFADPVSSEPLNIAVFYFPYILLPGFIVPAILFCHLASLSKLFGPQEDETY